MAKNKEARIRRNCLLCRKELYGAPDRKAAQDFSSPPLDAVVFTATGNYGSTLFDPPPYKHLFLEISICDSCLRERSEHVLQFYSKTDSTIYDIKSFAEALKAEAKAETET